MVLVWLTWHFNQGLKYKTKTKNEDIFPFWGLEEIIMKKTVLNIEISAEAIRYSFHVFAVGHIRWCSRISFSELTETGRTETKPRGGVKEERVDISSHQPVGPSRPQELSATKQVTIAT